MDRMVQSGFVSTMTAATSPDALIFNPHRILTTPSALYSYPPASTPTFQLGLFVGPDQHAFQAVIERAREAMLKAAYAELADDDKALAEVGLADYRELLKAYDHA